MFEFPVYLKYFIIKMKEKETCIPKLSLKIKEAAPWSNKIHLLP